jgi:putative membrane protein insertion efficiency factor
MKKIILRLIRFYQKYLSFDQGLIGRVFPIPKTCRFTPTCSQYTYTAVERYGIIVGLWMGVKRIIRCNPFNPGGVDPVK